MKEHYTSPFDSDAEAQEVINTSDRIRAAYRRDWEKRDEWDDNMEPIDPPKGPFTIGLDGTFSFADLMALIHFHPELVKQREQPTPVSDEVRVLELAAQQLSGALNDLLEACTGKPLAVIQAPARQAYMKARACLPAGYSMTLVKKESS